MKYRRLTLISKIIISFTVISYHLFHYCGCISHYFSFIPGLQVKFFCGIMPVIVFKGVHIYFSLSYSYSKAWQSFYRNIAGLGCGKCLLRNCIVLFALICL